MSSPIGFGRSNAFPFRFGGGISVVESVLQALLEEYSPGFSDDEPGEAFAEAYAEAVGIAMIYAVNRRVSNQGIPERMLENLPVWEEVFGIVVPDDSTPVARRRVVASKMRSIANKALKDISQVARKILGRNFVALRTVPVVEEVTYWPNINPGPPGMTFSSNRGIVFIIMNNKGINDVAFAQKAGALASEFFGWLPGWMWFEICVEVPGGFVPNEGIVGQTCI